MSNEVWVRWQDSTSSAGMVLVDTVNDLGDHAQIKDLRKAFVKQQVVNVSPAAVVVRETDNGEMLKANTMLTNYFMPPADSAAAPGPGNSEDTALFLTVPQQQQQQQRQPAFLVGAVVRGAKQSNGARGNVFKFLERHLGHYSEQEGIQIRYEQDDLHIHAYFLSYDAACQLQTALNEWEIHKELVNLRGVSLDPLTPAQTARPPDLKRIYLQDYNPQESESPCQTLDQLHSYRLSVPVTEPAEPNTPLVRFQSIDKVVPHLKHYKCHLKDKAKFKQLQNDENNMLAASWTFHQQLDGLNVEEGMPLAAISVKKASSGQIAAHDNRYSVTLLIEFFYPELAAVFAAPVGAGKGDQENTWETVVYVQDRNVFAECVRWKFQDTMEQWQKHRAFLEQE